MSDKQIAVVLASGGMDSCITAAIASQTYDIAMLHVTYGQRTQNAEKKAFHAIADHLGATKRLTVSLDHLAKIGGSSLTDSSMAVAEANLENKEVPTSYVPFRNAHMLSIATSWAEVLKAKRLFIGAVEEDSSGYPDCRREFMQAFNKVIALGTKPDTELEIETPLIAMDKAQIVTKGMQIHAPLHLTWSCYQNEDVACGKCDSCALRLRGFLRAGFNDPIPYHDERDRKRYY